jgi:hypothetical protein
VSGASLSPLVSNGQRSCGLYGSQLGERRLRAATTELMGTAVLVYTGTAVASADGCVVVGPLTGR